MKHNMPLKPKTQKEQISTLWDYTCNHVLSALSVQDLKLKFIIAFNALILGLLGIVIAQGV